MYKLKRNSLLGYILNNIIDFLLAPCMWYSFFSVLPDMNAPATQMNYDLDKLRNWVFQWEMSFNPDFTKLIFFIILLSICLNSNQVKQVSYKKIDYHYLW